MREEDKPFICVKRGWQMNIRPRNAEGWRQFGYWMAALVPIVLVYVWAMGTHPRPALIAVYTVFHLAAVGVWVFNMIRWMLARSQVIDLNASSDPKRRN